MILFSRKQKDVSDVSEIEREPSAVYGNGERRKGLITWSKRPKAETRKPDQTSTKWLCGIELTQYASM